MPLPEKGEYTNQFNRNTDRFTKELYNKIGSYNLNGDERTEIQKLVAERKERIEHLTQDLESARNESFGEHENELTPPKMRYIAENRQVRSLATAQNNWINGVKEVESTFDKNLDQLLGKVKSDGRGPDRRDYGQDRNNDNDRDR